MSRNLDTSTPRHPLDTTLDTSTPPVESANTALPVCTISDMSLHHCLPEYFCIARFNPCVILENTLSHFFEKHPRRGGLGTYVQHGLMLWCANTALPVCTISDMSLHHCLPEYFCIASFNPCVILENTLSQIFEKCPRRGGLGTYVPSQHPTAAERSQRPWPLYQLG